MVTAIVMIKTAVDRIPEVAQEVSGIDGVSEAYSVTGEWNLIAIVRVRTHEELAEVIPGHLNKIEGIVDTETHIAFRAYSSHDLEAAFSLGFDE